MCPEVALPKDWETAEYGSHCEVLNLMFDRHQIRRVLETGSGLYSTPLFLSHGVELTSIENNPEWAIPLGDNHTVVRVEGRVADHLPDLAGFDLVFIDDDPVKDREETIKRVLAGPHPLVVVHDTDWDPYNRLVNRHDPETFTARKPWTSVVLPT